MIDLQTLKLLSLLSPGGDTSNAPALGMGQQQQMGQIDIPQQISQLGQQPNQQPTGQQPSIPPFDTGDSQLQQMLNPKDVMANRFSDLINQIPQRQNFEPNLLRRISGFAANLGSGGPVGIAGGQPIGYKSDIPGGLKAQEAINDEPYNKAAQDWMNRASPTLEAAKLENVKNTNSRVGALGLRNTQLREEGLSRQRNWDATRAADLEEKQRQGQEKIDTSKQRAAAYEYDKMHPNHQYKTDQDGNVYSIDPKSNQIEYLTDKDGNYIKSDKLPDEMKAKLNQKNALEQIGARGSEARKTEEVRQTGRESIVDQKANNAVTGKAAKPETEAARHLRQFDLAVKAINEHPEWSDYIQLDPAHKIFHIDTPESKSGLFGLGAKKGGDPTIAKAAYDYVYGEGNKVSNTPNPKKELTRTDNRQKAIDILTKSKNPTTEANIKHVMDQLEGK